MLSFLNGLVFNGNLKLSKTKSGILITNDLGLNIEISENIWYSWNTFKK